MEEYLLSYRLVIAEKALSRGCLCKKFSVRQTAKMAIGREAVICQLVHEPLRPAWFQGIALLDESGGYPRLHYVFDVSDTAPRRNALYPDLWQINESLKEPVRSMLAENYGVQSESFGQQLADVAGKLVQS